MSLSLPGSMLLRLLQKHLSETNCPQPASFCLAACCCGSCRLLRQLPTTCQAGPGCTATIRFGVSMLHCDSQAAAVACQGSGQQWRLLCAHTICHLVPCRLHGLKGGTTILPSCRLVVVLACFQWHLLQLYNI